jgi:hypothetical protein
MMKQPETKVKNELTRQEPITVSRSPVIKYVGLAESQYQTWSYFIEIARVT